jgi:AcrR family transcriptional regulator
MRKIAQRDDIRDLILDAVDTLLARYGYKKMTMDDLAREVGIGKGTTYLHFPGKEEVVLAHIDRIAARLLENLGAIAAGPGSPEDKIRKMLIARILFRFDSVFHYSQNLNDLLASVRKPLLARRQVPFDQEAEALAAVIGRGNETGLFECPDPLSAGRAMVWSTNSLLPFSLTPRELGAREEIAGRAERIADLVLMGLVRRSPVREETGEKT